MTNTELFMEILKNNVRKSAFSYHRATNAIPFSWTIAIKLQNISTSLIKVTIIM